MQSDLGPVIGGVEREPEIRRPHIEFVDSPFLEFLGLVGAAIAIALVFLWFWGVFHLSPVHAAIPCEIVIERAKGLTIEQAMKRAESYGLTKKQLAEVRACLKEARK